MNKSKIYFNGYICFLQTYINKCPKNSTFVYTISYIYNFELLILIYTFVYYKIYTCGYG
jgi:hypothetical protein